MVETPVITKGHRVLASLVPFYLKADDYVAPFNVTQAGIARAVGISPARTSTELIELRKKGFVEAKKRHVNGQVRPSMETYWPTWKGLNFIKEVSQISGIPLEEMYPIPPELVQLKGKKSDRTPAMTMIADLEARFVAVEVD